MVERVGLIGHPVGHSISPQFQQAAFDALSLPIRYERWDTPEGTLEASVRRLRRAPYLGANVTVPHKQAVIELLDEVTGEAKVTGAVNCIVRRADRLNGYNTDVGGFRRALREELGISPAGKAVAVLGAGGAARGVVAALAHEQAARVLVLNRTLERATALVADLGDALRVNMEAGPLGEVTGAMLEGCSLIVNCTSVGLAGSSSEAAMPIAIEALPPGAAVVDIIANPLRTRFLRESALVGHPVMGGLSMLVHQGALAFELWTARAAPLQVMTAAAQAAMGLAAPARPEPGEST